MTTHGRADRGIVTRRKFLLAAAAAPLTTAFSVGDGSTLPAATPGARGLPAKGNFAPMPLTYLNSASTHPFSLGARQAVVQYLSGRSYEHGPPQWGLDATGDQVRAKFADLINAKSEEICIVQSTTSGEHLVLKALNIPSVGGRIVTDSLHYPDSFYLYDAMSKSGMDVVWVRSRDGKTIDLADLERAVTKDTKLVAVSLVSTVNGFQHDLKQVCDIAHAKGALVYADLVQAAGAVPIDVRQSDVDFAATASYKWLMGDFGLGLLYAREDLLHRLKRSQFGYYQLTSMQTHLYPFDPPGRSVVDYVVRSDATGQFATGTTAGAGVAQLNYSLDYLRELGVENIQRYRQPLLDQARAGLERLGYQCLTPPGASSPILAFAYDDADKLRPRLDAAKVRVTLVDNRLRISPSIFNDAADIDRLIEALTPTLRFNQSAECCLAPSGPTPPYEVAG